MTVYCTDYMRKFLDVGKLHYYAALAIQALETTPFDTIAFRGMSGALISPQVAIAMQKHLILVRKGNESSHSDYLVEGYKAAQRYVILDDFVSTGATRDAIKESVTTFAPKAKYVGILSVQYIDTDLVAYCMKNRIPYPLEEDRSREETLLLEMERSKKGVNGKRTKSA